jgi:hypothetical protein
MWKLLFIDTNQKFKGLKFRGVCNGLEDGGRKQRTNSKASLVLHENWKEFVLHATRVEYPYLNLYGDCLDTRHMIFFNS